MFANLAGEVEEYSARQVNRRRLPCRLGSIQNLQCIVVSQPVNDIDANFTGKSILTIDAS